MGKRCQTNYESKKQGCELQARNLHFAKSSTWRTLGNLGRVCGRARWVQTHTGASIRITPQMLAHPISIIPESVPNTDSFSSSTSSTDSTQVLCVLRSDYAVQRHLSPSSMWVGDGRMSETNSEREPHEKSEE